MVRPKKPKSGVKKRMMKFNFWGGGSNSSAPQEQKQKQLDCLSVFCPYKAETEEELKEHEKEHEK